MVRSDFRSFRNRATVLSRFRRAVVNAGAVAHHRALVVQGSGREVHFPAGGSYAAAGPAVRAALGDWRGRYVTVCAPDCGHPRASVRLRLIDWCSCPGNRLLDLYGSVFAQLAPLSQGTLDMEVQL